MVIFMQLGSISDQKTHNYVSGIRALQLEDGSASDQLDVLDQLVSRASGLQWENFSRAT